MLDKYVGCLIGSAIGDALGMPLEFLTKDKILELYHERVVEFLEPHIDHPFNGKLARGEYTDDTELTIAIAKSLTETNLENIEEKIGEAYKLSKRFGWGRTCRTACRGYSKGRTDQALDSTGSGAAMRISPVGLINSMNQQGYKQFINQVYIASAVTHDNPYAISGAMAVAAAVEYVKKAKHIDGMMNHILRATRLMEDFLRYKGYEDLRMSEIIEDGITGFEPSDVRTVVPSALKIFIEKSNSFSESVIEAANQGGDADTVAAIVGAISGAYHGFKKIPDSFVSELNGNIELISIARDLYEARLKVNKDC